MTRTTPSRPDAEAAVQTPAAGLPAFDDPSGRQRRCCACDLPTTRRVPAGEGKTIALCPADDTPELRAKYAGAARAG